MTEKLVRELNQGRLANATSDLLFPVLIEHRGELIERMCAKFRAGEKDLIAEIAQITYIGDLITEIQQVQKRGEHALKKLNDGKN